MNSIKNHFSSALFQLFLSIFVLLSIVQEAAASNMGYLAGLGNLLLILVLLVIMVIFLIGYLIMAVFKHSISEFTIIKANLIMRILSVVEISVLGWYTWNYYQTDETMIWFIFMIIVILNLWVFAISQSLRQKLNKQT